MLTQEDKEDIAAKIDSEGFEYYFCDYGPDEKLLSACGSQIDAFVEARDRLRSALEKAGIDLE